MKTGLFPVSAVLLLSAVPAATAAFGSTTASAVAGCKGGSGSQLMTTKSYGFVLRVGEEEVMYTPAQVRKMHSKSGEVMLRTSAPS